MKRTLLLLALLLTLPLMGQNERQTIRSGELWPDNTGVHINAHGGGILKYGDTFYWFGEHKSDHTSNALVVLLAMPLQTSSIGAIVGWL